MDQLELLTAMTDEDEDSILQAYLDNAESIILNKLYPYIEYDEDGKEKVHTLPNRYKNLQVRIAAYLLNKRGAEGETSHVENGVSRHYGASDIPADMLREIVPFGKVLV